MPVVQPWMGLQSPQVHNVSVHNSSSQSVLVPHSPQAQARQVRAEPPRAQPVSTPPVEAARHAPANQRGDSVSRQVSMPTKMAPEPRLAARPPLPRGLVVEPQQQCKNPRSPTRRDAPRPSSPPRKQADPRQRQTSRGAEQKSSARPGHDARQRAQSSALVPSGQPHRGQPLAPRSVYNDHPNLPHQATEKPPPRMRNTPRDNLENKLAPMEKIPYAQLTLLESLGSGEFGQVFRGYYRGREVAIKQLYWDNSIQGDTVVQDLEREIESFRHLSHKRLVKFIGACLELPHLCLVTEYVPAGSLHHLLHVRKMRLPLSHGLNMCLQIADAVQYLHSQNPVVVHRDLKSLNVVLDLQLNIKICDFGLTESMERTHITKKNNGGSPRYMAPELFDDKLKITEKIDIWAMGCIFIEIFGGPLPYEGCNNLADLTRAILVEHRAPYVPAHLVPALGSLARSMLDFDHRKRPVAHQVVDELKQIKRSLKQAGHL